MTPLSLTPSQALAYETSVIQKQSILLTAKAGYGKRQPLTEPILTPSGWKTMGDLRVGEYVMGANGKPTKILAIYEGGGLPMYQVNFNDGTYTECCEDHLWEVQTVHQRSKGGHYVLSLKEMLPRILAGRPSTKGYFYYSVKLCAPIDYYAQDLPIKPYLLGWLLGDACLTQQRILMSHLWSDSDEIKSLLEAELDNGNDKLTVYKPNPLSLSPNTGRFRFNKSVTDKLEQLGLIGKYSHEKFIPPQYLLGSIEQRLALLQGLMDSDGTVSYFSPTRCKFTFSNGSAQLIKGVEELVRSLGGSIRTTCTYRKDAYEHACQIRLNQPLFRLSRKLSKQQLYKPTWLPVKAIESVTYIGCLDGRCISVEAANHLYITRDFTVTHNSHVLQQILLGLEGEGYTTLRCAASGKAASLIQGITVHRASNLGTGSDMVLPKDVAPEPKLWNGKKRSMLRSRLANVDSKWIAPKLVCCIDEVYQLSSEDGRLWYDIGMAYRAEHKTELPPPLFIFSGDAGQFLPINGSLIFEPASFSHYDQRGLVTQTVLPSILDEIKPVTIELQENMRQSDPATQRALDWLYYGVAVHPLIKQRLQAAPSDAPTYYFNNALVQTENAAQLAQFKNNASKVYRGVGETLSLAEIKSLLPITEQMEIFVGAPFTVTTNIFNGQSMDVSNGEVVTVTALLRNSISAIKKCGKKVDLPYVAQYLPPNQHNGKQKVYQTLPGYPGSICSLMKMQGETVNTPVCFAAWQLNRGRFQSLKSQPGALYVMCSRVTKLELLFFDISLGLVQAEKLLEESLQVSPKVMRFLIKGKRSLYLADTFKKELVIELQKPFEFPGTDHNFISYQYLITDLCTGKEHTVVAVFSPSNNPCLKFETCAELQPDGFIKDRFRERVAMLEKLAIIYTEDYL